MFMVQPPCSFVNCRVDTGTLKTAPCQTNHVQTVVSCWTCALEGGVFVQITRFSREDRGVHIGVCVRHRVGAYALRAYARTVRITCSHLYFTDCAILGPYVIPRIVTYSWKLIPSSVGSCVHPYCKGFRFLGIEQGSSGLFITMYRIANDDKVFRTGYKDGYIISISDYWDAPLMSS
jgi:hypothetical protein